MATAQCCYLWDFWSARHCVMAGQSVLMDKFMSSYEIPPMVRKFDSERTLHWTGKRPPPEAFVHWWQHSIWMGVHMWIISRRLQRVALPVIADKEVEAIRNVGGFHFQFFNFENFEK